MSPGGGHSEGERIFLTGWLGGWCCFVLFLVVSIFLHFSRGVAAGLADGLRCVVVVSEEIECQSGAPIFHESILIFSVMTLGTIGSSAQHSLPNRSTIDHVVFVALVLSPFLSLSGVDGSTI